MHATLSSHDSALEVRASVAAWSSLAASPERIQLLRKSAGVAAKASPSLLRNADEQTIVGLAAVQDALRNLTQPHDLTSWGVLAAPVQFGRGANHSALERFREEGAWGISPHLIPQHSLHALSGTISQMLQLQGPNFGVSNGPSAAEEAFLIAGTMLSEGVTPGLWVVLTGHVVEHLPQDPAPDCLAVALALRPGGAEDARLELTLCPHDWADPRLPRSLAPVALHALAEALHEPAVSRAWRLGEFGWLKVESRCGENA